MSKSSPGARIRLATVPQQPLTGGQRGVWFSVDSWPMPALHLFCRGRRNGRVFCHIGSPPGRKCFIADKATAPCPAASVPRPWGASRDVAGLGSDIPRVTITLPPGKGGEGNSKGCRENFSADNLVGFSLPCSLLKNLPYH